MAKGLLNGGGRYGGSECENREKSAKSRANSYVMRRVLNDVGSGTMAFFLYPFCSLFCSLTFGDLHVSL